MTSTELDDRIRALVHGIADAAPTPRAFGDVHTRQATHGRPAERSRRRGPLVAAAAGLALILTITGTIVLLRSDQTARRPASTGTIRVTHEVIEYRATPNAACDTAQRRQPGRFRESHIDVWVDRAGRRARMRTVYPNGSTRDLITFGDGPIPDRMYTRGNELADLIGCGFGSGTFLDPGSGPRIPTAELAAMQSSHLTLVPGEHRDSHGRAAQLWTGSAPGSLEGPGFHVDETDETQLFVEPGTHRLLEQIVTTRWQTGATVTYRVTYISKEQTAVSVVTFSTDGFRDITAAHGSATTSLPTSAGP